MNRLTKKNKNTLTNDIEKYIINPFEELKTINKLGQLEDIEEELGIDLLVLKKVLEHGQEKYVYFKDEDNKIHKCDRAMIHIHICVDVLDEPIGSGYFCQEYLFVEEFGKTWALDKQTIEKIKEELEK